MKVNNLKTKSCNLTDQEKRQLLWHCLDFLFATAKKRDENLKTSEASQTTKKEGSSIYLKKLHK